MDVDLNSDLGEGCGLDAEIMPLVTSANVSCGFHAGDAASAQRALQLAIVHGVSPGAHPGYDDRANFGRVELNLDEEDIHRMCSYQIGALAGLARSLGVALRYFKPHGALYNQACREDRFARPVIAAAELFALPLLGLPGSRLEALSQDRCRFIAEGFADRRYLPDGTLTPRSQPGAMLDEVDEAVRQADWLIRAHGVRSLCVHGDNPRAVAFVRGLREELTRRGLTLRAFA
ncbi:MAG: LamB/YcsF family protein [Planctomycetes bacterium]|nr:LamB/YcsF family protein [Planctomycetota bacterium]